MTKSAGRIVITTLLAMTSVASLALSDASDNPKKLQDAKAVFQELMSSTDRSVPKELLEGARCIAVIPGVMKAALGYGVRHGKGVMSCRTSSGWSAPSFININGGSAGFQFGVESTDLVLFFMNESGAKSLVNG